MPNKETATIGVHESALERLRSSAEGRVVVPGDTDYEIARLAWNLSVQHFPAVVVEAATAEDVQAAVRFANEAALKVGVQATGHGIPRTCVGGVLIRLENLNRVSVDSDAATATIGGGAQWKHVFEISQRFGLAGLSGSAPHVGVVGYMLGGGISLLGRKYGLGVDSILSMKVVLADGSLAKVSAEENADLFWAIRGGGGGFGVVVEMTFRLYPAGEVFGGAVFYPAERAAEIYPKYLEWTRSLPDAVTSSISLMFFPPVPFIPEFLHLKSFVIITGCVTDLERGEQLMAPMREMGGAAVDSFARFPYAQSGEIYKDPVDPIPANGNGVLLHDLAPETLADLLEAIGPMHRSPHLKIEIRHLGGAIAANGDAETSYGHRRAAKYLIYLLGVPIPPNTPEAMVAQAEQLFGVLGESVMCPGPLNFIGEADVPEERMRGVFADEEYARLREIKSQRDPGNVFAFAGLGICGE